MPTPSSIQDTLNSANKMLAQHYDDGLLQASILLAHVLGISRAQLLTRPEQQLQESLRQEFFDMIARRLRGEPIAYLIGHREFWSLDLIVNEHTLIPRPETELLVELALDRIPQNSQFHVLDLGTGSGAIALAIAKERPLCRVIATDACPQALVVARTNAERLNIRNVTFLEGEWFTPFDTEIFDVVVSNPPYVAQGDPHLLHGDLPAEPRRALVAGVSGMEMLTTIARQAPHHLRTDGWLLLEHGYNQGKSVADLLRKSGYLHVRTWLDLAGMERISEGQLR